MADKSFGVRQLNLIGIGTPTIESSDTINLDAPTVAISTNITIGGISSVGSAITMYGSSGIISATKYYGDGSGLTGIIASGTGIGVEEEGSSLGTATTINFVGTGLTATISGTVATVDISGISSGISSLSDDITPELGGDLHSQGNEIKLGDSSGVGINRLTFGASSDLSIFHAPLDSNSAHISNRTNDLIISTSDVGDHTGRDIILNAADDVDIQVAGGTTAIYATGGGSVKLNHSGSTKLETTNDGIVITGITTSTSFVKSSNSGGFLKADGTEDTNTYLTSLGTAIVDGDFTSNGFMKRTGAGTYAVDSNTYLTTESDPVVGAINGIVKANGSGTISTATAGTDYLTPSGDGSSLTGLTGASAATYGSAGATPVIVVDSNGRITGISTVATSGGGGGGTVSEAFKTISVSGQSNVVADSATDTLTLVAGNRMTITTNASGDSITFAASASGTESNGNMNVTAGVTYQLNTYSASTYVNTEYILFFQHTSGIQSQRVLVMDDGINAYSEEYGIMHSNDLLVSVGATLSSGTVRLQFTPEAGVSGVITYSYRREELS